MFSTRPLAIALVLASLCACGRSTGNTILPNAGQPEELVRRGEALTRTSWMRAGTAAHTLLYVSDSGGVTVYTNPSGNTFQLAGELFGFQTPAGECSDAHGNVFIADENARDIVEYAHGAITPKAVIPDTLGQPLSCAIDRKTGRLAVTNFADPNGNEPGNVAIYPSPSQNPTEYTNPTLYVPLFCSFDRKGNLYVDAYDSGYKAELAVLPKGAPSFTILTVSGGTFNIPSGILVDGSQLLVGDFDDHDSRISQVVVRGSTATIVGSIALTKTNELAEFVLFGSGSATAILAPDNSLSNVGIYAYPGGSFLGSITAGVSQPIGTAISE